jgi:hypothetical protein
MFQINVVEKIRTHILYSAIFFAENRAIYETMLKNEVVPEGATNDVTTWRIRVACWINKATRTHTPMHCGTYIQINV